LDICKTDCQAGVGSANGLFASLKMTKKKEEDPEMNSG
jgi:hypothetical protein